MHRPAPKSTSRLSYLVGPGPSAASSPVRLRIGISNSGDEVEALRLRLSLRSSAGGMELAKAEIGLVLPRRCGREVAAGIDWTEGRLELGSRSASIRSAGASGPILARAELFDGRAGEPEVLEVGLRSTEASPSERP